ncbi:hypothetical protein [Paraburkholderia strydomiana]|uniref:hypothetical protein n=1 Tax=Paraburkholderia strydomiana TaxID=1245417 RepID=UPI0038B8B96B
MVVVSCEAARIVYKQRLPNDPVQIRTAPAPLREDLAAMVIEASQNSYSHCRRFQYYRPRISAVMPVLSCPDAEEPVIKQFWTKTTATLPDHMFPDMDAAPQRAYASLSRLATIGALGPDPIVTTEYGATTVVQTATSQRCHILDLPMPGKIAAAAAPHQIVSRGGRVWVGQGLTACVTTSPSPARPRLHQSAKTGAGKRSRKTVENNAIAATRTRQQTVVHSGPSAAQVRCIRLSTVYI